jgi:hypothetical protein
MQPVNPDPVPPFQPISPPPVVPPPAPPANEPPYTGLPTTHIQDENYKWQWYANLILVVVSLLAVIANVVAQAGSAELLGLTDVQWHWILLVSASLIAINTALNHTPPVMNVPNKLP